MITCYLKYTIDPHKLTEFEEYARLWIPIVNRMGGTHHGYFLPYEGRTTSQSRYSVFPAWPPTKTIVFRMTENSECMHVYAIEKRNRSIFRYERSFMRPIGQSATLE